MPAQGQGGGAENLELSQNWQYIPRFHVHFGKASCYQLSFGQTLEYHRYLTRGSRWGYGQWIYFTASRKMQIALVLVLVAVCNGVRLGRDKGACTEADW